MSPLWRWYLLGYLMALPHTLVGLLLSLVYRCHSFRWERGVLTCIGGTFQRDGKAVTRIWGRPGAQTHGWLVIYADERARSSRFLRIHEHVHVVHGFIGGVVYALAYVFCFLVLWGYQRDGWYRAYHSSPFEQHAYRVGYAGKGWGE